MYIYIYNRFNQQKNVGKNQHDQPTRNVKMYKKASGPEHLWKLRCAKSARRCGAKHISKSKCTKHTIVGPLLEVEMCKKCTPWLREAHFDVNMYNTSQVRSTFRRQPHHTTLQLQLQMQLQLQLPLLLLLLLLLLLQLKLGNRLTRLWGWQIWNWDFRG